MKVTEILLGLCWVDKRHQRILAVRNRYCLLHRQRDSVRRIPMIDGCKITESRLVTKGLGSVHGLSGVKCLYILDIYLNRILTRPGQ